MTPEQGCPVLVSDEPWQGDLAVTGPEAVTPERIMEAARRKLGLPLIIAEEAQTILRELTPEDYPAVRRLVTEENPAAGGVKPEAEAEAAKRAAEGNPAACGVKPEAECEAAKKMPRECSDLLFSEERLADPEYFAAYVKNQYPLFGYGLWGLFRKSDGQLLGVAGFDAPPDDSADLELGYHIGKDFRRQGCAFQACLAALAYAEEELGAERILIRIRRDNLPSLYFSEKLKASLLQMKGRFQLHITVL